MADKAVKYTGVGVNGLKRRKTLVNFISMRPQRIGLFLEHLYTG